MEDTEPEPGIFYNQATSSGRTGIPTQPQNCQLGGDGATERVGVAYQ